jgi:AcrR family transcriptional regulator
MAIERTALILRVATEEFLAQGFEGTTLSNIARRCRISKTTLYGLFSTKEALFSHVVTASIVNFTTSIEAAIDIDRPLDEVVRDVIVAIIDSVSDKQTNRLMRLVVAEGARFPAMASLTRQRGSALMNPLARYFMHVAPHLEPRRATRLVNHLTSMAMGGFGCLLDRPSSLYADRREWVDSIMKIFMAGFPRQVPTVNQATRGSP